MRAGGRAPREPATPHAKQLATIMRPFLTKVVEGGDVYNRGE